MSNQPEPGQRFLTLEAAAALLGQGVTVVSSAIRRGDLPAIDLGRRGGVRVERAVLEQYAATRQIPLCDPQLAGPSGIRNAGSGPPSTAAEPRELSVGDPDGLGRYGVLEENDDGLLCVECGWSGRHLGLHSARAHGLSAGYLGLCAAPRLRPAVLLE